MLDKFNQYMHDYINNLNCNNKIRNVINYGLINNGKRIRPQLILTYLDDELKLDYFDVAMSIECIHAYSLIHDDLPCMDNDLYRRGAKSVWNEYDEASALLAGDSLLTIAFSLVANANVCKCKRNKLTQILAQYSGINQGMINGQVLDLEQGDKSFNQLIEIACQKTGALIVASLLMANTIDPKNEEQDLVKLGYLLGILYQVQDDFLDKYSTFEVIGKDIGSDEDNNKTTFATILNKNQILQLIDLIKEQINKLLFNLNLTNEFRQLINDIITREF